MAIISRGFSGRRSATDAKLPPGQYLTTDFPVLSAGPTPHVSLDRWEFVIDDGTNVLRRWDWKSFRDLPTETFTVTRKLLKESLVFNHRADVERVIFISTPHRGSKLASGWIGRIGAALVKTPRLFTSVYTSTKPLLVSDPAARTLKRMPNSVDTLEPNDRFVQVVDKLPITRGIPYDSIMGDRGRGNTPNSSDGVVPYWSSHLDGAQSELIVDSGHDAQTNPEAIDEVARILKENLAVASR